ncbi:uncharacterized protein LOC134532846 isoform X2 [Bacillus rossius redtenbacheri]|uniref:uncharacterized protein LOC134532846 isoform X2 n=1 Tax=Bacillus rossius redtenbacheri TaxID=93214 RepID=UPI002FDE4705
MSEISPHTTIKVEPVEAVDPSVQTDANGTTIQAGNGVVSQNMGTAINKVASQTIKQEIDESNSVTQCSDGTAAHSKASDNIIKGNSLLRTILIGANKNLQKPSAEQHIGQQSGQATTVQPVVRSSEQSSTDEAFSLRECLIPGMEADDMYSDSESERDELDATKRAPQQKRNPVLSEHPQGDSSQNSASQGIGDVDQPGKTPAGKTNIFSCIACGMSFRFRSTFITHLERNVKKLSYDCKHCATKMVFYNKCKLIDHMRMHGEDTTVPDADDLVSLIISKSHHSQEPSLEGEDSDSDIEICDFDSQLRTLFDGAASDAVKSECTVEKNNSAVEKSKMTGNKVVKDITTYNRLKSVKLSADPAGKKPAHSKGSSDPAGGRLKHAVGNPDTEVNRSETTDGGLDPVLSIPESAGSSINSAVIASESANVSRDSAFSGPDSAGGSVDSAVSGSESAGGSFDSTLSGTDSAVDKIVPTVNRCKSASRSLGSAVSRSQTAVEIPKPVTSKSRFQAGSFKNTGNRSVICLDHASQKSEVIAEKAEPGSKRSQPANKTMSYILNRNMSPVVSSSSSIIRHTETKSTHALVRHISSIRPVHSNLRPSASSVRPVLSVRPFHSGKPLPTYRWVSSVGTQISVLKNDSAVTTSESTVARPAVSTSEPVCVGLRVKGFALEQKDNIPNINVINPPDNVEIICSECKTKMLLGELQSHFQTVNPLLTVDSLRCLRCVLILPTSCSFIAHKRIHAKLKPFVCPECGHVFTTFEMLTVHLHSVCFHMQKCVCYCCTFCKVLCNTADELVDHIMRSKHFVYAFMCTACNAVYQEFAELQSHIEERHAPIQQPSKRIYYKCLLCPHKLICVQDIRVHAASHPKMRDSLVYYYKCGTCSFVAYSKDKFASHREVCSAALPTLSNVRPSHKLIVKQKDKASAPQTVLIQAIDSRGNVTFQRQLLHGSFVNGQTNAVRSPIKIVKKSSLHSNANMRHKTANPVPNSNISPKTINPLPNSAVINFVDTNAGCENTYSINETRENNSDEARDSGMPIEENETMFTTNFGDAGEGNEKDPLSLEGMEPSKTTTSSCVVCGKFVERSLIRSGVQRVPVRCASCVAKSCYESKSKTSTVLVVSPKSISSSSIQPSDAGPARKKRRLSSSATNDKFKCSRCSCLLVSVDHAVIQSHYKSVHDEELSPELLEQEVKAAKEKATISSTKVDGKTDKKNGLDQSTKSAGSSTKAKKKKKTSKSVESKSNATITHSAPENYDVHEKIDNESDVKSDDGQKDLREGYPCNYGNCQFSTSDLSAFKEHIISHRSEEYIYQCMECGFASKSGFSLSYHLMIKHGIVDAQSYANDKKECYFGGESDSSDCDSDCSWSESRNNSTENVAENECRVCRETFESSQELGQHIRTHGMAFLVHMRKNRNSLLEKQVVS